MFLCCQEDAIAETKKMSSEFHYLTVVRCAYLYYTLCANHRLHFTDGNEVRVLCLTPLRLFTRGIKLVMFLPLSTTILISRTCNIMLTIAI